MEKQDGGHESVSDDVSPEAGPMRWVAPLQSIATLSIAEFTQNDSNPGDDGLGIFTQS